MCAVLDGLPCLFSMLLVAPFEYECLSNIDVNRAVCVCQDIDAQVDATVSVELALGSSASSIG